MCGRLLAVAWGQRKTARRRRGYLRTRVRAGIRWNSRLPWEAEKTMCFLLNYLRVLQIYISFSPLIIYELLPNNNTIPNNNRYIGNWACSPLQRRPSLVRLLLATCLSPLIWDAGHNNYTKLSQNQARISKFTFLKLVLYFAKLCRGGQGSEIFQIILLTLLFEVKFLFELGVALK